MAAFVPSMCQLTLIGPSLLKPRTIRATPGRHLIGASTTNDTMLTVGCNKAGTFGIAPRVMALQFTPAAGWIATNLSTMDPFKVTAIDSSNLEDATVKVMPSKCAPLATDMVVQIAGLAWARYKVTITPLATALEVDTKKNDDEEHDGETEHDDGLDACWDLLDPIIQRGLDAARCSVCMCPFTKAVALRSCAHVFCADCIEQWFTTSAKTTCPLCKTPQFEIPKRLLGMDTIVNCLLPVVVKARRATHFCAEVAAAAAANAMLSCAMEGLTPVWSAPSSMLVDYFEYINQLRREPRVIACRKLGLTSEKVMECTSVESISRILQVFGIIPRRGKWPLPHLKQRLIFFIHYF
jgi:hypothetical protein